MSFRTGPFTRRQMGAEVVRAEKAVRYVKSWEKKWVDLGSIKVFRWECSQSQPKAVSLGPQRAFIQSEPLNAEADEPKSSKVKLANEKAAWQSNQTESQSHTRSKPLLLLPTANDESSANKDTLPESVSLDGSAAPTPQPGSPPVSEQPLLALEGSFSPMAADSARNTPQPAVSAALTASSAVPNGFSAAAHQAQDLDQLGMPGMGETQVATVKVPDDSTMALDEPQLADVSTPTILDDTAIAHDGSTMALDEPQVVLDSMTMPQAKTNDAVQLNSDAIYTGAGELPPGNVERDEHTATAMEEETALPTVGEERVSGVSERLPHMDLLAPVSPADGPHGLSVEQSYEVSTGNGSQALVDTDAESTNDNKDSLKVVDMNCHGVSLAAISQSTTLVDGFQKPSSQPATPGITFGTPSIQIAELGPVDNQSIGLADEPNIINNQSDDGTEPSIQTDQFYVPLTAHKTLPCGPDADAMADLVTKESHTSTSASGDGPTEAVSLGLMNDINKAIPLLDTSLVFQSQSDTAAVATPTVTCSASLSANATDERESISDVEQTSTHKAAFPAKDTGS